MHTLIRLGLVAFAFGSSFTVQAQDPLPPPLREWQGWVLRGEEFRRCPFLASANLQPGQPIDASAFRCVWPERLTLNVDARGGTFTQRWQVFSESWVTLPGSLEHWPLDVRVNGAPAAVVSVDGAPTLRLKPGAYAVSGRFAWSTRPESLPLASQSALVELSVDGQRVAQPERPGGAVWLGKRRSAEQRTALEVQVYRLVQDEIPAYLLTRIRLNVAGDAREELLGHVLPKGFTPVSLEGDLPARLERIGTLRVQVRAGVHELTLVARGVNVASTLSRPDTGQIQWPREEVWSFAANDSLRVAAVEGAEGIDPAQANVPPEWRSFPAFRIPMAGSLTVVERTRGLSNADANRLKLAREIWLDFDHGGYTTVDRILGTMRRDWRLDMQAPFELQSAMLGGDQLLVTEGKEGRAGVELRQPDIDLRAFARKGAGGGAMPATGWDSRFDLVTGVLNLPPGHQLLAAVGADAAPGSWWESWGLWNVFGVLIVVVFVYWAAGIMPAAIAALALLLMYQEAPSYIWLWGNLLAALGIARAAPEGRFARFARGYRTLSFVVLALFLLPLAWIQVRYALYPQLEPPRQAAEITVNSSSDLQNPYGLSASWQAGPVDRFIDSFSSAPHAENVPAIEAEIVGEISPMEMADSSAAAAAVPAPPPSPMSPARALANSSAGKLAGLNSQMIVQRYAAGTVLQAGPGWPSWHFNSYNYYWSGPVEPTDTVRFVYVGPVIMFFWRIVGVIALVALFLVLAALSFGGPEALARLKLPGRPRRAAVWLPSAFASLLWLCGGAAPAPAMAAEPGAPATELLTELKTRLTAAPSCAPSCAEITHAQVGVDGDRLEVVLQVSSLASLAVAMPHASDRWQLDEVSVDSRGSLAMSREQDASLWVPLDVGAHTVRLAGRLASAESLQLVFPQAPRKIDVNARGWTASGVNEGRLVSGSLELARVREERAGATLQAGSEFPAYVRVHRLFNLDLDWTLDTVVTRIAPQRAAIATDVPLMAGESVLTPGIEVRDGKVLVGLGAGQQDTSWHSGLVRAESLELSLPEDAARSEVWSFIVNPQWNVTFSGFAPVLPENAERGTWVFRFMPRPGEKLTLALTRPQGVKGTTLAIDSAQLSTSVGQRTSNSLLMFAYRSTQGGQHVVKLPADARVEMVKFDGREQQVRPENGELPLSITPGRHQFQISWENSAAVGIRTHPAEVDLGSPASNIRTTLRMPDSRWVLFATGPGFGPAILYWGELVVFIGMAWLLSRWPKSPLKFTEWLLLGLGLSTQSWFVFIVTGGWLLLMRWREGWQPAGIGRWRFNTVQVLLALFTLFAITSLVFSGIRNGLLAQPDMSIAFGFLGGGFSWFQDQVDRVIKTPTVWSVPMWIYRVLFFAWAGWMAFALVRWLRWAFNAWKSNGLWR